MSAVLKSTQGGYRFVSGVFQYSAGVAAEPGNEIVRARFAKLVPMMEGFSRIEKYLAGLGRPVHAFCACELRSPRPFDEAGFLAFNKGYVEPLQRWGIIKDGVNPIARSNVCPAVKPPSEPGFLRILLHHAGGQVCCADFRHRRQWRSAGGPEKLP